MKIRTLASWASWPLLALALACAGGCKSPEPTSGSTAAVELPAPDPRLGPPVVLGTVIEAATGQPVAGAKVVAPNGLEALTDDSGRFQLRGLEHGSEGELQASSGDLAGSIRLRPLLGGRLEVVLHLR